MAHEPQDFEIFRERYEAGTSDAKGGVGPAVFGVEGLEGYTTSKQADGMSDALGLGADDVLLDLGAGRGWPGVRVLERSGCRLVSTDVPFAAMAKAKESFERRGARAVCACADGVALPFRARTFNAVIHADVLC